MLINLDLVGANSFLFWRIVLLTQSIVDSVFDLILCCPNIITKGFGWMLQSEADFSNLTTTLLWIMSMYLMEPMYPV